MASALAYPYYLYPYYGSPYDPYVAPVYQDPVYGSPPLSQPETHVTVAPTVPREVCYDTGCYQGDGVTVPYQWVWVPAASAPPPPPSSP